MKKLKVNMYKALEILNNENGGPNVEQVVGIAVALAVGSGLFIFGGTVFHWFENDATKSVGEIPIPETDTWRL